MLSIVLLTWQLSAICPLVQHYRNSGYTDAQIEEMAHAHRIPAWIINYAKRKCAS